MQKLRRQNTAVSNHDDEIRLQGAEHFFRFAVPQRRRLPDRDAVLHRQLLDRRGGQHLFAADRLIGAGEHADDLMPGGDQRAKAFGRKVRRTHKQDAHYSSSSPSG